MLSCYAVSFPFVGFLANCPSFVRVAPGSRGPPLLCVGIGGGGLGGWVGGSPGITLCLYCACAIAVGEQAGVQRSRWQRLTQDMRAQMSMGMHHRDSPTASGMAWHPRFWQETPATLGMGSSLLTSHWLIWCYWQFWPRPETETGANAKTKTEPETEAETGTGTEDVT